MVDLVYCLTRWLFFDILLLYHYINLNSSRICCLSSKHIYLSFGIYVLLPTNSELFCGGFFSILLAILLPIKSPVFLAVFFYYLLIAFFEAALNAFVVGDCLEWSRSLWLLLLLTFLFIFLPMFLPILLAKDKNQ